MKTYQIALPDEVAAFVDRVLAEKKWDSPENLFAYALLQVQEEIEADADLDLDALRKQIQVGIDQADRGETAELDTGAIWARAERRLADKQEAAHAPGDANPTGR